MKIPKINAAPGTGGNKKASGISSFLAENKKQLITTAITMVACLVICGVASTGRGIFTDMQAQAEQAVVDVSNKMDNLRKSDRYFTQDAEKKDYNKVRVEWIPANGRPAAEAVVDPGRWTTDDRIFWDFISPAFTFNSATEYNQMRENYISQLGNCLFTVQFLAYYDIEAHATPDGNGNITAKAIEEANLRYNCTSDPTMFVSYPTAVDSEGNYTYFAMVPMKSTYVGFTYKIVHSLGQGGNDRITLCDFDCWPPNGSAKMSTK